MNAKSKQVYTSSFGIVTVELSDRYNGHTIEEIEAMPFIGWSECHKKEYINNCKRVIECQTSGYNLNEIECLKNSNFNLVRFYMSIN